MKRQEIEPGPFRRALRKWYPLAPKTKEELIETLQRLKEEEEQGHKEYLEVANAARKIHPGTAATLRRIAADESGHAHQLAEEIDLIR